MSGAVIECYQVKLESTCALPVSAPSESEACSKATEIIRKTPSALVWRATAIDSCDPGSRSVAPESPLEEVMGGCRLSPWIIEAPDWIISDGEWGVVFELTLVVIAPNQAAAIRQAFKSIDCLVQWEIGYE